MPNESEIVLLRKLYLDIYMLILTIEILEFYVLILHGQRSTFEFPSRVNLSVPSLYCIARTLGK